MGFGVSIVLTYPILVWEARSSLNGMACGGRPYAFRRYLLLNLLIVGLTGCG